MGGIYYQPTAAQVRGATRHAARQSS